MTFLEAKARLQKELNNIECTEILEYIFKVDKEHFFNFYDKSLTPTQEEKIEEIIAKRKSGYPLQYITGKWYFMGNEFFVSEGVLIPRDDTEVLVRSVLPYIKENLFKDDKFSVLDMCSGSGIIAISLKKMFPKISVSAFEKSKKAIEYLNKNIRHNCVDVKVIEGDVFTHSTFFPDSSFDLIISNPPYIDSKDMLTLQKEVTYEPPIALYGGKDGMDFYREIVENYTKKLKKGGMLAFEIGENQYEYIKEMMSESYKDIAFFYDLGNCIRAINGTLKQKDENLFENS